MMNAGTGAAKPGNRSNVALVLVLVFASLCAIVVAVTFFRRSSDNTHLPTVPSDLKQRVTRCVHPLRVEFSSGKTNQASIIVQHGSCVAVGKEGTFLTAAHLLQPAETRQAIFLLINGREVEADLMDVDKSLDSAILRISGREGAFLELSAGAIERGQSAFVFGYPTKYSGTTFPRILATGARIVHTDYSYTDPNDETKPISVVLLQGTSHFGSSGGAVVDQDGKMIGLAIASRFPSTKTQNSSHVLAVPVTRLASLLRRGTERKAGE